MSSEILRGPHYLLRGASLLPHPQLRAFVIVPLLINIVIFSVLLSYAYSSLSNAVDTLIGRLPDWLHFLRYLLVPLLVLAGALLAGWLFTSVATLIAAPFNSLLAEKTLALQQGRTVGTLEGLGSALAAVPRSLAREVRKLLYFLPRVALVLLAMLLPPLAPIAPVLWLLLTAWIMAVQYIDYPADNAGIPFKVVLARLRYHGGLSLGFGGSVAFAASVPLVNLVVMPAAVVGATLLWHERVGRD
jgi:CysZ protein